MKEKILIVAGDPNSINTEIILKVWKKLSISIRKNVYIIGNGELIKKQFLKLKTKLPVTILQQFEEHVISKNLKIINIPLNFKNPFNVPKKSASKYMFNCLNLAHSLAKNYSVKGLINCPINKKLIGNSNIGITEYLAAKNKVTKDSEVMLIYNKNLSVVPITTHVRIRNISKLISIKIITRKIKTLNKGLSKILRKKPKIAILGLNPHNAEFLKSSEEHKVIIPSIRKLRKENIDVYGPFSADTMFIEEHKKFDVIVGMYHDQVLTPFKTLFNYDAINITLGLKYLRVSPDHGPAKNIILKNKANELSLLNCIKFLNR